eukprot:2445474-Rhodomonas_salina.2
MQGNCWPHLKHRCRQQPHSLIHDRHTAASVKDSTLYIRMGFLPALKEAGRQTDLSKILSIGCPSSLSITSLAFCPENPAGPARRQRQNPRLRRRQR